MSGYETIKVEIDASGVASLILNRPDKHNALNARMIAELHQAADSLGNDRSVRAVVLRGEGESFCAGGDLGWMREQFDNDRSVKIAEAKALAAMLKSLDELPKLLICAARGNAYGGGVGMLAVCDIVIAANDCRFALTETRLGLIPATIGPYVMRRIGEGRARSVFMNARPFDAAFGQWLGLVTTIATSDELDGVIDREIKTVLECAPGAIANAKALCRSLARDTTIDPLNFSAEKLADQWETSEAELGIKSFFERQRPPWVPEK